MQEEVVFLTHCQFARNQKVTVGPSPNLGSQVWTPALRELGSFSLVEFSGGADNLLFHSSGKMQKGLVCLGK